MSIPTIETSHLTIREYAVSDLTARNQLINDTFHQNESLADTESWLQWTIASYRELTRLHQPPYGDYAIALKSGEVIGSVGLVPAMVPWGVLPEYRDPIELAHTQTSAEFGLFWGILPAHQKHGYATEAAQMFVFTIFRQINPVRVVATTERTNIASQRVMRKIGMAIYENQSVNVPWFEVVGVMDNPQTRRFYP